MTKKTQQFSIFELKESKKWPPNTIPDIYFSGFEHWHNDLNIKRIEETFFQIAKVTGDGKSLDINFGNPILLKLINKHYKDRYALYVDKTKLDENINIKNTTILEGDCYSIPFPDSTFNIVTSYAFLHLIPDHKTFFKEVFRVLNGKGCFYADGDKNLNITKLIRIFKLFVCQITRNKIEYLKWKKILQPKDNFHQEGIDYNACKKYLLSAGFKRVEVNTWITMKPQYQKKIYISFILKLLKFFRLNFLFTHVQIIAYKS